MPKIVKETSSMKSNPDAFSMALIYSHVRYHKTKEGLFGWRYGVYFILVVSQKARDRVW